MGGLCLWGAGAQIGEAVAAVGMGLTVVGLAWTRVPWRAWRPFWPIGLYVGWALLAPLLAGAWPSGAGFFRTLDWAFVAAGALAFAELDERGRRTVAIACGAALLVSCLVAALQFFGAWPSREAMQPFAFLRLPFDRVYEPASAGSTSHFMAGGLLFHRLKFAGVSGVFALWAVTLAVQQRGRERVAAAVVAVAGVLSVLIFPVVRAAALALLAAVAFTAAVASAQRRAAFALGIGLLALGGAVAALNPELRARVASASSVMGDEDRVFLRRAALTAFMRHPLVGLGAGRYRAADYMSPDAPASVHTHQGKAHLQILSVAVEAGIPGAALFVAMLIWLAKQLWPRGAAGLGVLLYLAVMGLLHDPLFHAETSMAVAFTLAAALGVWPDQFTGNAFNSYGGENRE
ncbi:MAG TPA: O-antigen ligase family protein [Myxococcaceae bacterium]